MRKQIGMQVPTSPVLFLDSYENGIFKKNNCILCLTLDTPDLHQEH